VNLGLDILAMGMGAGAHRGLDTSLGLGLGNLLDLAALHYDYALETNRSTATNVWQSMAIVPMMDHGRTGFTVLGRF
jgi:hypothetical protein